MLRSKKAYNFLVLECEPASVYADKVSRPPSAAHAYASLANVRHQHANIDRCEQTQA